MDSSTVHVTVFLDSKLHPSRSGHSVTRVSESRPWGEEACNVDPKSLRCSASKLPEKDTHVILQGLGEPCFTTALFLAEDVNSITQECITAWSCTNTSISCRTSQTSLSSKRILIQKPPSSPAGCPWAFTPRNTAQVPHHISTPRASHLSSNPELGKKKPAPMEPGSSYPHS